MLPTDVQAEAVPLILGGGDVLMAAETGSGKTGKVFFFKYHPKPKKLSLLNSGAFCIPIIQIVWETIKDIQSGKHNSNQNHNGGSQGESQNPRISDSLTYSGFPLR